MRSLRVSFQHTADRIRAAIDDPQCGGGSQPAGPRLMLLNTGVSRLDLMKPFDGTFSEFHAINAVGLLGAASPAILWVYPGGSSGCCGNATETL